MNEDELRKALRELISEQDTVTDYNCKTGGMAGGWRDHYMAEMREAQARRDAIRDRILAEFAELRAQRDDLLAALQPFAYLAEVLEEGQVLNFRGIYVTWEQAEAARAAIAKAKGEEGRA